MTRKRRLTTVDVADFPWVAPLPGSPLLSDLHSIRLILLVPELSIRYSGGLLMSVINDMAETNALAVLPLSVVFAQRPENRIAVLPLDIPQPTGSLGAFAPHRTAPLRRRRAVRGACDRGIKELKHLIKRHENAVVWGR